MNFKKSGFRLDYWASSYLEARVKLDNFQKE